MLKKIFIDYGNYQHNPHIVYTPLFATVRDISEFNYSSQPRFSDFLLSQLPVSPNKNLPANFLFIIDGLDEIEESNSDNIINTILSLKSENDILWISSRKEFFFNHVKPNSPFFELFDEVMEIQEWNIESDSLRFAEAYAKKYKDAGLFEQLLRLRKHSPTIDHFLKKPFELTLILYLLSKAADLSTKTFDSSYTLYQSFYKNWLEREQFKDITTLVPDDIQRLHQSVSIALYKNRGNGITLAQIDPGKLNIDATHDSLRSNSSFWDLLITTQNRGEEIIDRFWHETIGEFILAEELIQSFCSTSQHFRDHLQTIYNHEINLFIREGFQQLSADEKHLVYEKLSAAYFSEFLTHGTILPETVNATSIESMAIEANSINNDEVSVRIREQIIYYLGRLELNFYPPILSFAAKFESIPLLQRSAILGGILYHHEKMESEYLQTLTSLSPNDILNRSVQLVYFGDVYGDIHTFQDTNIYSWEKTRQAIVARLKNDSKRDLALRWWDLKTLYCFFESRGWKDKITEADFNAIRDCRCDSPLHKESRSQTLHDEVSCILFNLKNKGCVTKK